MDAVLAVTNRMTVMLDGRALACGRRVTSDRSGGRDAYLGRRMSVPIIEARGVVAGYSMQARCCAASTWS